MKLSRKFKFTTGIVALLATVGVFFINTTSTTVDPLEQYYLERYNSFFSANCGGYSFFTCGTRTLDQFKAHISACGGAQTYWATYSSDSFVGCAPIAAVFPMMRTDYYGTNSMPWFHDPQVMLTNAANGKYPAIPGRADCLWGQDVIKHTYSVPAYSTPTADNCDAAGVKESRTCSYGILGGSYTYKSCSKPPPPPPPALATKNGCYIDEVSCVRPAGSTDVTQVQLQTSFGSGTLPTLLARSDVQGSEQLCAELSDVFSKTNKCQATVYGMFVKDSQMSVLMNFEEKPADNTNAVMAIINSLLLNE